MFTFPSKCPHCQGTSFEMVVSEPKSSRYKMNITQCSSCKAPIGVSNYYDSGALLKQQANEIADLKRQLAQIDYNVQMIMQALRRAA